MAPFSYEPGDCGLVQQLRMLNRSADTDAWYVSDEFLHFLQNILHLSVKIRGLSVYSKG